MYLSFQICTNLASLISIGEGEVLKDTPIPPTSLPEIMAGMQFSPCTIYCLGGAQSSSGRIIVVLGDSTSTVEESKKLYLQTGRVPISYEWVLQCVSAFRIVETTTFELAVVHGEDMAALLTQNSQAF